MTMDAPRPRDPELELRDYNQRLIELLKQNQRVSRQPHNPKPVLSTTAPIIDNKKSNSYKNGWENSQPTRSSQSARQKLAGAKPDSKPKDSSSKYSYYKSTDSVNRVGTKPVSRKPVAQGIAIVDMGEPSRYERRDRERGQRMTETYREEQYDIGDAGDQYYSTSNAEKRYAEYERFDSELEHDLENVRSLLEESQSSLANKSSTPVGSPTLTPQGTPKSILRRRKLIDDNIQVRSKYPHTPLNHVTPKQGGVANLNYSYSDVDDEDLAQRLDDQLHTGLNGSYTEELEARAPSNTPNSSRLAEAKPRTTDDKPPQAPAPSKKTTKVKRPRSESPSNRILTRTQKRDQEKQLSAVEMLMVKNRMKDSGNDRRNVSVVRDLAHRPKAVLFDLEAPEPDDHSVHSITMNSQSLTTQGSKNQSLNSTHSSVRAAWQQGKENQPLLGYDWIAGLLDNEIGMVNEPDAYFKELSEFRKRNKYDCVGKEQPTLNGSLPAPISPTVQDPKHTCIHGYSVSERLFTQPMNVDEAGRSVCPICLVDRKDPTPVDPGFIRVSIPRSTLAAPYRVMPHRRRSFDPSDSYSLSNHCLQGWQTAKPSTIPTASTVDLKQGIKDKEILSYDEVQKLADSVSKLGRLMNPDHSRNNSLNHSAGLNFSSVSNATPATQGLLDKSHSLRAELQYLERQTGMSRSAGANSTHYPLF